MTSYPGATGTSLRDHAARCHDITGQNSLYTRVSKKLQLESKTHRIVPDSTIESKKNFHLPAPWIYEDKKAILGVVNEKSQSRQLLGEFGYLLPMMMNEGCVEKTAIVKKIERGLMDLPAEVRNKIYRLATVTDHIILVCACSVCKADSQPAITRANRQIRSEALPIFFGENRFRIQHAHRVGDEAPKWICKMSLKTRSLVRHVEMRTRSFQSAVTVMAMYDFELQRGMSPGNDSGKVGRIENSPLWLVFKGHALDVDTAGKTTEVASIAETERFTTGIAEMGTALVAHLMRPKLVIFGPRDERKPLPAIPSDDGEIEEKVAFVTTVEKGIRARLEKRSKANSSVFNRELQ